MKDELEKVIKTLLFKIKECECLEQQTSCDLCRKRRAIIYALRTALHILDEVKSLENIQPCI